MGNIEYAECYAELANAIVLQAFKDYCTAETGRPSCIG